MRGTARLGVVVLGAALVISGSPNGPGPASAATGGSLVAWGYNGFGQTTIPGDLGPVIAMSAGGSHSVAILPGGTVRAWGDTASGALNIPAGLVAQQVVASNMFNIARRGDGSLVGWGANGFGQASPPVLTDAVDIAAGPYHALAIRASGAVVGWGQNGSGQATPPAGLVAEAVAAGNEWSMVLASDGTVVTWGNLQGGKLAVPAGLGQVAKIAAGFNHAVALRDDGTVVAWGVNTYGQTAVPTGLDRVVEVAAGASSSYALRDDGTVVAWGLDQHGQVTGAAAITGAIHISANGAHGLALVQAPPDTIAPTVQAGAVTLRKGARLSGTALPVRLSWSGSDNASGSGIAAYHVERRVNAGSWQWVRDTDTAPFDTTVASSGSTEFRVSAVDEAGNWSEPSAFTALRPALVQQGSSTLTYRGVWRTARSTRYSGGSARYATRAGSRTTFVFTGRSIALVSTRAATRGRVRIYVDGATVPVTVDLRGATAYRWVAWARAWPVAGRHTVRLVVVGTSGRPRVDIDGFGILR